MTKLFIPVKGNSKPLSEVDSLDYMLIERSFGKTEYFVLIDSDTGSFDLIKNTNKHRGGTKHTPDIINDADAEVVIAAHIGPGAYSGSKNYGINVLRGDLNTPLSIIVEKFNSGVLKEFPEPEGHHHDHNHHHDH